MKTFISHENQTFSYGRSSCHSPYAVRPGQFLCLPYQGAQYVPRWVTPSGAYMVDEFFPDRDSDPNMDYSYVRLMEESPERIVVHWRYFPDIQSIREANDRLEPTFLGGFTAAVHETFTIYPDGTGIRKVVYNNSTTEAPGFQDIQFFTNPGETALDVVPLNAVTVGNIYGETEEMVWKKPNRNPQTDLREATIQYQNIHADWKIYALYPEPVIGTWGSFEQSAYTDDPFAGPWNHWPVSVVPSDGRFAVNTDRVTHFAVGAGNHRYQGRRIPGLRPARKSLPAPYGR